MEILNQENLHIKNWAKGIEEKALAQAVNLSNLPFAYHHIALMPDCHMGYGMPIGGVLATQGVIIPNAVGVDIGCGMLAVKTKASHISEEQLINIMGYAKLAIPVGFHKHSESKWDYSPATENLKLDAEIFGPTIVQQELDKAGYALGTLGGGNHFVEIQKGSDDHIWLMIHSGSRNLGKQVADHYNKVAVGLNEQYYSQVPKEHQLAFLPVNSLEGMNYLMEMEFCLKYAQQNRGMMMDAFMEIFNGVMGLPETPYNPINIHHNYVALEHHFGKDVYVHRKGAIRMREGEIGVIPGSMGTSSYIVEGLGSNNSFMSASHGAGRTMGRKAANMSISEDEATASMQGIVHDDFNGQFDEAPMAYKDIESVMANQVDLVTPLVKLRPLAVMKG